MLVRRASHVHQMPHTGRAHNGPVTKTMVQKITPTSAVASAQASAERRRDLRYQSEAIKLAKKQVKATKAEGT